jgi:predicted O-methyltransferase YrrM
MKQSLRSFLERTPYIGNLYRRINKQGEYPAGHYYSPIPDRDEVLEYIESRKPLMMELPDVKLNREKQFNLLNDYVRFYTELPFPEEKNSEYRYYYNNILYCYSDAIFLYSFLRKHLPKRIIEIGAGFSTAVMLDTIDGFFSDRPDITLIEPHPDRLKSLLRSEDENYVKILDKKIQHVPTELFLSLKAGDLLFIDSSHVIKCGNDLQMLMFEVLPLLPPGIFVHFHDVFYPFDYPPQWLKQGRYWNENYFLRTFLAYNYEWSLYFFNTYAIIAFYHFIKDKMPLCLKNSGGSLYIKRERKGL